MKSFTLVELLVAVCILAVGLVGVLRSFLGAISVLDHVNTRLLAVEILDEKAGELVVRSILGVGDGSPEADESMALQGRQAVYHVERLALEAEAQKGLDQLTLSLAWKEGNKAKDETMVFFVQGKR